MTHLNILRITRYPVDEAPFFVEAFHLIVLSDRFRQATDCPGVTEEKIVDLDQYMMSLHDE